MSTNDVRLERRPAVARLIQDRGDLLIVAGLGSAIWDVEAVGENPLNFYMLGAMGSVSSVALGLALARPDRRVLGLTGDAELMMGLGTLPTIALRRPRNLSIVAIDNELFGETGSQASHTGAGVELAGIAEACGIPIVRRVRDEAGVDELRGLIHGGEGPVFATMKVTPTMPPVVMPIRDGAYLKHRFRAALLGDQALKE